jgi:creatinine amidohydrolase
VSISHSTLTAIIRDVFESLWRSGVDRLVLVNGHGGNYVLSNVVQEANVAGPVMTLFPTREDWSAARLAAALGSNGHGDMHPGKLKSSLRQHVAPELLRPGFEEIDHQSSDRRLLLVHGMATYTTSG